MTDEQLQTFVILWWGVSLCGIGTFLTCLVGVLTGHLFLGFLSVVLLAAALLFAAVLWRLSTL